MATSAQHMAARGDRDLLERLIAVAEMNHIPSASSWVQANMGTLISTPVEAQQTISDVHAFASGQRENYLADNKALPPGLNPAAVTDVHLKTAIEALYQPAQPSGEGA